MGTALTEQQLEPSRRALTRNLYLCFDADAAGIGAMSRALTLGRRMDLTLHVVRIPDGLDPADYVLSGAGGDGFRALAADAQTLLQFHVRLALATHDLDRPDGRARAFARLRGVLSEAATPIERDEELRYVADRLQLSAESVRYLLSGGGRAARRAPPAASRSGASRGAAGPRSPSAAPTSSRCASWPAAWRSPDTGREVLAGVDEGFFATAETRAALPPRQGAIGGATAAGNTLPSAERPGGRGRGRRRRSRRSIVRAGRERFTATVVDELFLRLQEAQVGRLIARLKVTVRS